MSMPRHNARRDAAEPEIVSTLPKRRSKNLGLFDCLECGVTKRGRVTKGKGKYCSQDCRYEHAKVRLIGECNPNYKAAGFKTCIDCGAIFHSYNKSRKYCSQKCYRTMRNFFQKSVKVVEKKFKPKANYGPKRSCKVCGKECAQLAACFCSRSCAVKNRRLNSKYECNHCSTVFSAFPSSKRKFCSYQCFVSNGGAHRAGMASAEAIMKKYGAKKDANHKEVFAVMDQFCATYDMSLCGYGVPDGAAFIKGNWHLFDVKNPKTSYGRKGLNPRQKKWLEDWRGGPVYLIYNTDEAQRFAKGDFEGLKKELSGYQVEIAKGGEQ